MKWENNPSKPSNCMQDYNRIPYKFVLRMFVLRGLESSEGALKRNSESSHKSPGAPERVAGTI